ncbi:MAG: hypothetical protein QXX35_00955 [Desulfurococcaceae archaeon]|uniref:Uncharacterized protein n=1 Tax=Staphylothermus marinus TaxID=2280 RepID=A0A7C4HD30_STAMA
MKKNRYKCIVCGRVFPHGQGIVVKTGNLSLEFHSSRCASKFLRRLIENSSFEEIGRCVKETYEEFVKRLEVFEKKRVKKI